METEGTGSDLRQRIGAFLNEWHVMSLATADRGRPHAANLLYACDGLGLVWVSAPNARHSRAIETCPHVTATIAPDCDDFASIRGVQIDGTARQVTDPDERQANLGLLEARYAFLSRRASLSPALRGAYAEAAVYRLEPSRVVLIDNTRGFGHKDVLNMLVSTETRSSRSSSGRQRRNSSCGG